MSQPDRTPAASHIARALGSYDIGPVSAIEPLGGGHLNEPHVVAAGRGRYFVKLLAPHLSAPPALEARHAFIEHLTAAAVPVPRLVRTAHGRTCARSDGRVVEVYEFVVGRAHRRGDVTQAKAAGEVIANLHRAALDFDPPAPGIRRGWLAPEEDLAYLDRYEQQMRTYVPAPEAFAPVEQVKRVVRKTSADLAAADLPTAMIHGDFRPGNLMYRPAGGPAITDFDYCHVAPLIFDLATAIIGFAGEEPSEPETTVGDDVAGALLAAYGALRPLTYAEQEMLQPTVGRVLVHLHLQAGSSPEKIAGALERAPLTDGS